MLAGVSGAYRAYKTYKKVHPYLGRAAALGVAAASRYMRKNNNKQQTKQGPFPKSRKRVSGKKSRSRTVVKTQRKKEKKQSNRYQATTGYESRHTITYKKARGGKMVTWAKQPLVAEALMTFSCDTSIAGGGTNTTNDQGKQIINGIADNQSQGICGSQLLIDMWEQHAKLRNTTGPAYITLDGNATGMKYNSLYVESVKAEYSYTNQSPFTTEVDLYFCQLKNSQKTFPTNQFKTDWQDGYLDASANLATCNQSFYGSKPTDSKAFNMHWRIVQKVSSTMQAGEEHKHIFNFNPGRIISTGHAEEFAGGIRGLWHTVFMVARGSIADTTNSWQAGSITTARVKIVGVLKTKYKVYAVNVFPRLNTQTSNLATGQPFVYVIGDASGVPVNAELATTYA